MAKRQKNDNKFNHWTQEENLDMIKSYLSAGVLEKELLRDVLDINEKTFNEWLERSPEFKNAVEKGFGQVKKVVRSLEKLCHGFYVEETKTDPMGRESKIKKYIPPQIQAIIFYLKSRDPENWDKESTAELKGNFKQLVIRNDL